MGHRHLLAQQPVGADNLILYVAVDRPIHNQEVITDRIIGVKVTALAHRIRRQLGLHLLDEHPVAYRLGSVDLALGTGEACLEASNPAQQIACLVPRQRLTGVYVHVVLQEFERHGNLPYRFKSPSIIMIPRQENDNDCNNGNRLSRGPFAD